MIVVGLLAACAPPGEPGLEHALDDADRQAAEQFGDALITDEPPAVVCPTHATWLVHLVATTTDPTLAGAAMQGLAGCEDDWNAADVRRATARWWGAKGSAVPAGLVAIAESFVANAEPDDPIVQGLVQLGTG
ncbi:MAG: hypothetical protein AAF211_04045, partial [Myxococcota bacterium]